MIRWEKKVYYNLPILFVLPIVSGCAWLADGPTQKVTFNSVPDGAEVIIEDVPRGITPLSIVLEPEDGQNISIRKDGYREIQTQLATKTSGMFWVNAAWGLFGLFSSTTDYSTGSMKRYDQDMYFFTLDKLESSSLESIQFSESEKIMQFVLANYNLLENDVSQGDGEYLSSLIFLLNSKGTNNLTKHEVKTLLLQSKNRFEFVALLTRSDPSMHPRKDFSKAFANKGLFNN